MKYNEIRRHGMMEDDDELVRSLANVPAAQNKTKTIEKNCILFS